jgi:hypothetical protein
MSEKEGGAAWVAQGALPVVEFKDDQDWAILKTVFEQKSAEAGTGGEQAICALWSPILHLVSCWVIPRNS